MKNVFKKILTLAVLAAALIFAPAKQTPAEALGASLAASVVKTENVTAVHYRRWRHHHRHYRYHRYHRRHHRRVYVRVYI
ncbi:MAG: hypothetical protein ABL894_13245 [Hyphomicrobium sp.]